MAACVPRCGGVFAFSALSRTRCRTRILPPLFFATSTSTSPTRGGGGGGSAGGGGGGGGILRPYPRRAYSSTAGSETCSPSEAPSSPIDDVMEAAKSLDMRVGRILKAWRHPEADSLYVEEVDIGEDQPRTICSGLVNYIPLHQLQDIMVVVLANLKPRNMRGVKSNGMLMAASDASHEIVELLFPPEGSVPGEKIWFGADEEKDKQPEPAKPNQVQKKKIWESVQPYLKTTDSCIAVLGQHPMRTSAGVVACRSLKNGNIS